ncbi:MAG: hypothetical protein INR62_03205 [Rhodospirillales bacterium]|nr:hypothetical protein [Acetobacter sp.]
MLIFRRRISSLFPLIRRFKYRDLEIEFRKSLEAAVEKSRAALPAQSATPTVPLLPDRVYSLAELSPRAAILEAWLKVEEAGIDALREKDPSFDSKRMLPPLRLGELLNQNQIINGKQLEIFHQLRDLRNKAAHMINAVFSSDEAAKYISLAAALASQISRGSYGS